MAKKILMSKGEARGLSASESIKFVKDMLKTKSKKLTLKDFEPGSLLMYRYNAKNKEETFDATPMTLVLKTSRRYVLSINFHWLPVPLRIILVKKILQMNTKNIKAGKKLEFDYKTFRYFKLNGVGTIIGTVDSQNSFGAMIRSNFKVQFDCNDNMKPIHMSFEGNEIF